MTCIVTQSGPSNAQDHSETHGHAAALVRLLGNKSSLQCFGRAQIESTINMIKNKSMCGITTLTLILISGKIVLYFLGSKSASYASKL